MSSLNFNCGIHTISREGVYEDVLKLYVSSDVLHHYPVMMHFNGEMALDGGGIKRDVFAAFFEEMYCHLFEGSSLVIPLIRPGVSLDTVAVIGAIISHAYLISATLPVRVAFPCLASILCSSYNDHSIPDNVLVEIFIDSLSNYDAIICQRARKEVRMDYSSFSEKVFNDLSQVLSSYSCRELPTPHNLEEILLQVARYQFHMKPAALIATFRSGIPDCHKPFWNNVSVPHLYSIYRAMAVSTDKIISSINSNCEPGNPSEERVLMYLRQYIGSLSKKKLSIF